MSFFPRAAWASRLPFFIAVALIAAALGDALVETISNAGVVGHGYRDDNHLSVLPALIAGASLALLVIARRCLGLFRDRDEHGDWLVGMARHISARSPLHDLPHVLILQFIALFIMESCEQLCFGGRLLGGAVWLGGPIWFSILSHALLGSLCLFVTARAMRAIVKRAALLIGTALELIRDAFARENCAIFASRREQSHSLCSQTLRVHQMGGRAPPLLLLPIN